MDMGIATATTQILSSTTEYFFQISPLMLVIGGIVLAFAIADKIIDTVKKSDLDNLDNNSNI